MLDLYARVFEGKRLRPDEYVISADEKSQLQALGRQHETVAPGPGRPGRSSSSTSAAARSRTWPRGTCTTPTCSTASSRTTGIVPFGRLVDQVMTTEPYAPRGPSTGSSTTAPRHAGKTSVKRMQRPLAERPADPPPRARLVAEPDRDVLLDRATQSADPERLRRPSTRSPTAARRSASTTDRSPDRSSGPSPAKTSTP